MIDMKGFIKELLRYMSGVFFPLQTGKEDLTREINEVIGNLSYYGRDNDRRNMRGDVESICRDLKKSTNEAKVKFSKADLW